MSTSTLYANVIKSPVADGTITIGSDTATTVINGSTITFPPTTSVTLTDLQCNTIAPTVPNTSINVSNGGTTVDALIINGNALVTGRLVVDGEFVDPGGVVPLNIDTLSCTLGSGPPDFPPANAFFQLGIDAVGATPAQNASKFHVNADDIQISASNENDIIFGSDTVRASVLINSTPGNPGYLTIPETGAIIVGSNDASGIQPIVLNADFAANYTAVLLQNPLGATQSFVLSDTGENNLVINGGTSTQLRLTGTEPTISLVGDTQNINLTGNNSTISLASTAGISGITLSCSDTNGPAMSMQTTENLSVSFGIGGASVNTANFQLSAPDYNVQFGQSGANFDPCVFQLFGQQATLTVGEDTNANPSFILQCNDVGTAELVVGTNVDQGTIVINGGAASIDAAFLPITSTITNVGILGATLNPLTYTTVTTSDGLGTTGFLATNNFRVDNDVTLDGGKNYMQINTNNAGTTQFTCVGSAPGIEVDGATGALVNFTVNGNGGFPATQGFQIPVYDTTPATVTDGLMWYDLITSQLCVQINGIPCYVPVLPLG